MVAQVPLLLIVALKFLGFGLITQGVPVPKYVGGKPGPAIPRLRVASSIGPMTVLIHPSANGLEILARHTANLLVSGHTSSRQRSYTHSQVTTMPLIKATTASRAAYGIDPRRGSDVLVIVVKHAVETLNILMRFRFHVMNQSARPPPRPAARRRIRVVVLHESLRWGRKSAFTVERA